MAAPKGSIRKASGKTAPIDLSGKVIGEWTVHERDPNNRRNWLCTCSCGVKRSVDGANLRSGVSPSCGHLRRQKWLDRCEAQRKEVEGERFGFLVVQSTYLGKDRRGHGEGMATCKCECGTVKDFLISVLVRGDAKSCGCFNSKLSSERAARRNETHEPVHSRDGFVGFVPKGTAPAYEHQTYLCKPCGETKSSVNFPKGKGGGRSHICTKCTIERQKKREVQRAEMDARKAAEREALLSAIPARADGIKPPWAR